MRKLFFICLGFTLLAILNIRHFAIPQTVFGQSVQTSQPVQLVNGHPQFQFRGQPFFAHSTAFFYNRIPRDEWAASLVKLKEIGINTVDLYIAWNWHEPEEGKLDFDGHSNPRRDVKALMEMTAEMGFACTICSSPAVTSF